MSKVVFLISLGIGGSLSACAERASKDGLPLAESAPPREPAPPRELVSDSAAPPRAEDVPTRTAVHCGEAPGVDAGATALGEVSSERSTGAARGDPPGFRGFDDPSGRLPHAPPPPAFESASAKCPVDMALIEGTHCGSPIQTCKRWLDPPNKPHRSCAEFESPTRCGGAEQKMRYCIDRYEFTPPGYSLPIVRVSWTEAGILCGAMGKRLCTEDEWEFACEGPDALPYPYGYVRDGAACNHDAKDSFFSARGKLVDQRRAQQALPHCVSPFGVFNLVGNVDEWTVRVPADPGERSVLRGGWWLQGRNRCRAATDSHGENYAGPQTGFRCCRPAR